MRTISVIISDCTVYAYNNGILLSATEMIDINLHASFERLTEALEAFVGRIPNVWYYNVSNVVETENRIDFNVNIHYHFER